MNASFGQRWIGDWRNKDNANRCSKSTHLESIYKNKRQKIIKHDTDNRVGPRSFLKRISYYALLKHKLNIQEILGPYTEVLQKIYNRMTLYELLYKLNVILVVPLKQLKLKDCFAI